MSRRKELAKKIMEGIPLTPEEENYRERMRAIILSVPIDPEFVRHLNFLLHRGKSTDLET